MTSTVDMRDELRGRPIQKAKVRWNCMLHNLLVLVFYVVLANMSLPAYVQIEILLGKTENFDELMAAAAEERDAADGEEQG